MTEADWLICTEPQSMLKFLRGKASDRKLRLFTCACCRRIWHLMEDERSRKAVEVLERCVDGPENDDEWQRAGTAADEARHEFERDNPEHQGPAASADSCARWAAYYINFTNRPEWSSSHAAMAMVWEKIQQGIHHRVAQVQERTHECSLLRDLFGNPFRSSPIAPSWQTPAVITVAGHLYDDRAFDRLPVLADALEEAGCHDEAILAHCRSRGPHVRGCWVVDLILGKS